MPPAARLSFPSVSHAHRSPSVSVTTSAAPQRFRVQGWDPVLILSQIIALQALHYLALALVLPALLSILAHRDLLLYEGGATSISVAMNWRSFTGATASGYPASRALTAGLVPLAAVHHPDLLVSTTALDPAELARGVVRVVPRDALRGWAVALGWVAASMADILFLYHIVRRPTHILDFSLTLLFNHLILTTYYSSAFPSSLFFWFVVGASAVAQIVLAEQMCVQREMRDGFSVAEMTPRLGGAGGSGGGGAGNGGMTPGPATAAGLSGEWTPHVPELELSAMAPGGGKGSGHPAGYERVRSEDRGRGAP